MLGVTRRSIQSIVRLHGEAAVVPLCRHTNILSTRSLSAFLGPESTIQSPKCNHPGTSWGGLGSQNNTLMTHRREVDSMLEVVFRNIVPLPYAISVPGVVIPIDILHTDIIIGQKIVTEDKPMSNTSIQVMNRNARRAKKANKGARPCSRASRRSKKEKIGKRSRK
ncbi:hypothetical protein IV203_036571 [Nitzschia inconspicua]|uniref:Uncharacterized protein n=1 Tax=Nitzschia inconspicua TaxID=303405 RepID=A0A9K3LGK1_9STRA|nr:hypothetical protein IV203_036571 [Nitzschia inconspicua]